MSEAKELLDLLRQIDENRYLLHSVGSVTIRTFIQKAHCLPTLLEELDRLREAAQLARTALDSLWIRYSMGDSDIDDDYSVEFQAMQALNDILSPEPPQEREVEKA